MSPVPDHGGVACHRSLSMINRRRRRRLYYLLVRIYLDYDITLYYNITYMMNSHIEQMNHYLLLFCGGVCMLRCQTTRPYLLSTPSYSLSPPRIISHTRLSERVCD